VERRADSWAAFCGWSVAGLGMGLGVMSMLTIGPFVLLATLVLCAVLLYRPGVGTAMAGLASGIGVPPLYVAWLNRDGPGTVCSHTATSSACTDEWTPWPFLVVGLMLLAVGVVVFVRLRRR